MSRLVDSWEYDSTPEFNLGDWVSFDYEDTKLVGEVVRVYNTRENYHVEVDGKRYSVNVSEDNPVLIKHVVCSCGIKIPLNVKQEEE